jgi:hypothetical protein
VSYAQQPVPRRHPHYAWIDPAPDAAAVRPEQAARMTSLWGDDSWRHEAYRLGRQRGLFGDKVEKVENADVAEAYRRRLQSVAGFAHVPQPIPMRNGVGAVVYYLFFVSQTGVEILQANSVFTRTAASDSGLRLAMFPVAHRV